MNPARLLLAVLVAFAALSWAPPARADKAAAEALFQAGKDLSDQGNWAEACPKFEGSFKLDEQLGTLLNLANCLEQVGRLASAWVRFKAAIEWAERSNDKRLSWIKERHDALLPRLAKLTVVVTKPAPGLSVWRDGSPVVRESFGVSLPVDPGERVLVVRRGETVLQEQKVTLAEGEERRVALDLAAIAAAHPVAAPPPPPPPPPPQPSEPYDPTQRNIGFIVGGVGAIAVLAAGALEIAALVKKGEADQPDACVNKVCSPQGLEAAQDGATFAEAGQWLGIGGLVALAVGATVLLTAPSEDDAAGRGQPAAPPVQARLLPWVGPGGAGLGLSLSY